MGNDNSAGVLSQDEIDQLLKAASGGGDSAQPEDREDPAPAGETDAVDSPSPDTRSETVTMLSQEDLDDLLSDVMDSDPSDEGDAVRPDAESDQKTSGVLSQEDLDALFANAAADGDPEPETAAGTAGADESAAPPGEEDPETVATLSQEDVDDLLANVMDSASPDADEAPDTEADARDDDGGTAATLSQEDVDDLLGNAMDAAEPETAPAADEQEDKAAKPSNSLLSDNDLKVFEAYQNLKKSGGSTLPPKKKKKVPETPSDAGEDEDIAGGSAAPGAIEEISLLSQEDLDDLLPDSGSPEVPDEAEITAEADPDDSAAEPTAIPGDSDSPIKAPAATEIDDTVALADLEDDGFITPEPTKPVRLSEIREIKSRGSGRTEKLKIAAAVLFCLAAVGGGWHAVRSGLFTTHVKPLLAKVQRLVPAQHGLSQPADPPPETKPPERSPTPRPAPIAPSETASLPADTWDADLSGLPPRLRERVTAAEQLRQTLLAKQSEFLKLQQHYRGGIEAIRETLRENMGRLDDASADTALGDPRIRMQLTTIQRRMAYIARLAELSEEFDEAAERLLFLKRQAVIGALLQPVAGGLDADSLAIHIHATSQTYAVDLNSISFDVDPAMERPLAEIWRDIADGAAREPAAPEKPTAPPPEAVAGPVNTPGDAACGQNVAQKHLLTALSEADARCLAQWNGRDLVLNNLTELSPAAARQLSRWPGDWLALNGFTEISADTARYLFQWKGQRLSLNGLSRLTPDVSSHIADWKGKQLELIGLAELSEPVAAHLTQWMENGGELYVPERFTK